MTDSTLLAGPHTHAKTSIAKTMVLVILALTPATLLGLYQFGWPAIWLFLITVGSAVVTEAACLAIAGKPLRPFLGDGSAALTGWLLAMTLPPWAPWWIGVVGSIIAILIGKQVFGGIGQNLFNPAMVARVALLISFPLQMTSFTAPLPIFSDAAPSAVAALAITFGEEQTPFDAVSSATVLGHVRTELGRGQSLDLFLPTAYDPLALGWGNVAGSMGETSALLILLGGLFLLWRRVITWHIPVALLGTLFTLATLANLLAPGQYPGGLYHLLAGATVLGAFFIATDLVTSPVSIRGQLVYGAGIGALVFVIRTWAGYPEGMAFAVMLMNAGTPLIDHYLRPRIYGRDRHGKPLNHAEPEERKP